MTSQLTRYCLLQRVSEEFSIRVLFLYLINNRFQATIEDITEIFISDAHKKDVHARNLIFSDLRQWFVTREDQDQFLLTIEKINRNSSYSTHPTWAMQCHPARRTVNAIFFYKNKNVRFQSQIFIMINWSTLISMNAWIMINLPPFIRKKG